MRNRNIVRVYLIGQATETIILWFISDRRENRNRNIVGGISGKRDIRNRNIVGVYLIGQATETIILWCKSDRRENRNNIIVVYIW